jgi:hypothetical protein
VYIQYPPHNPIEIGVTKDPDTALGLKVFLVLYIYDFKWPVNEMERTKTGIHTRRSGTGFHVVWIEFVMAP